MNRGDAAADGGLWVRTAGLFRDHSIFMGTTAASPPASIDCLFGDPT